MFHTILFEQEENDAIEIARKMAMNHEYVGFGLRLAQCYNFFLQSGIIAAWTPCDLISIQSSHSSLLTPAVTA